MKRLILAVLVMYSMAAHAQNGIEFVQGSTWRMVKEKAKKEHKYIFVDCYATWCGPCKLMDEQVYPDQKVGAAYNKDFVSFRLQMDRTPKDDEQTKKNYVIARTFESNYAIREYPTFLFFDEDGNPVHKVSGSQSPAQFIELAKDAQNPKRQYYHILKNFVPGKMDLVEERGLALSFQFSDNKLAGKLVNDYLSRIPRKKLADSLNIDLMKQFSSDSLIAKKAQAYIYDLPTKQLLANQNSIEFLSAFTLKSTDKGFNVFEKNTAKIDTIMHWNGYANICIDGVIYKENVLQTLKKSKLSKQEPDWMQISQTISQKFGENHVNATIWKAKAAWYEELNDHKNYIKYTLLRFKNIPLNHVSPGGTNNFAYEIFLYSDDLNELNTALDWANYLTTLDVQNGTYLDTKANILYKLGKKEEALILETKAAELKPKDKEIAQALQKMRQGLPTWNQDGN